jgi:hypothetical protein
MSSLTTHLDDLLTVLRASADLPAAALTPDRVGRELADQLDRLSPRLADRVRRLDDWHAETLSEFLTEAHLLPAPARRQLARPDRVPGYLRPADLRRGPDAGLRPADVPVLAQPEWLTRSIRAPGLARSA